MLFLTQLKAQMVYHDHEDLHKTLNKDSVSSNTFQVLDKEVQVLNYVEVCQLIKYPPVAYQAGFEGLVQVRVLVDQYGKVANLFFIISLVLIHESRLFLYFLKGSQSNCSLLASLGKRPSLKKYTISAPISSNV